MHPLVLFFIATRDKRAGAADQDTMRDALWRFCPIWQTRHTHHPRRYHHVKLSIDDGTRVTDRRYAVGDRRRNV